MDLDEPMEENELEEPAELADVDDYARPAEVSDSSYGYAKPRKSTKTNRSRKLYIRKSITRLSVISDRPLHTKSDICAALEDYGHCLPPEQRAALEKWCGIR